MNGSGRRARILVMYEDSWTKWKPSPAGRVLGAVLLFGFMSLAVLATAQSILEERRRDRSRGTMKRIRAIGAALEDHASITGEYPCVRSTRDLPPGIAAKFAPEALRDKWGRPIMVTAGGRRYLVMSLGSDGVADREYRELTFDGDAGDPIYSNGAWLHRPSGVSTDSAFLPRVADAFAEMPPCPPNPPARRAVAPSTGLYECEFYLYLPSEEAARAAAADFTRLGFDIEVRRAASSADWLCRSTRRLESCSEAERSMWRIAEAHGG